MPTKTIDEIAREAARRWTKGKRLDDIIAAAIREACAPLVEELARTKTICGDAALAFADAHDGKSPDLSHYASELGKACCRARTLIAAFDEPEETTKPPASG